MWQKYIAFGDSVTAGIGDPVDSCLLYTSPSPRD